MDPKITQEILDDLIPSIEAVEARSTAVLEFLKSEGIATDEKLAPYLEQAASASNVRWLGVRVRVERLLAAAEKESAENAAEARKKPEDAHSDETQKLPESGEKQSPEVKATEPESREKSNSGQSPGSEESRAKSDDEKNKSPQAPREQAEKVATLPAKDGKQNGERPKAGDNESAVPENPTKQNVA